MNCPSTPYDILGIISFVQGCLTLIAAVFGALWSVTQQVVLSRSLLFQARGSYTNTSILLSQLQVRVNKTSIDSLFSKITQLQIQHEGSSLVKSGTTRRLLGKYADFLYFCSLETETFPIRLEREKNALQPITIATPLHQWLNQSQIALDLARISNNVETIVSELYLVGASSPMLT